MANPNAGRIAELKSQMAQEQNASQQAASEKKTAQYLQQSVLKAIEQVEDTLDQQIAKMAEVENLGEDELDALRERRKQQMKQEALKLAKWRQDGHGATVVDEKDFFAQAKTEERMVVHFGRDTTPRCLILDGHLLSLARLHLETKFVRVNVERCPFLCERLKIYTLPSLVLVKNGRTDKTLVGFDDFGGDDFTLMELETCLLKYHVISGIKSGAGEVKEKKRGGISLDDDWQD